MVEPILAPSDVRAIRTRLGLSQQAFAATFGFSYGSVQDWEQGRRRPEHSARILLMAIDAEPDFVRQIVVRNGRVTQQPH